MSTPAAHVLGAVPESPAKAGTQQRFKIYCKMAVFLVWCKFLIAGPGLWAVADLICPPVSTSFTLICLACNNRNRRTGEQLTWNYGNIRQGTIRNI